jgi:peroxiredoxin
MTAMPSSRRFMPLAGALTLLVLAAGAPADAGKRTAFRLPNLEGRKVGPADFRGKVIVADFWATWCAPCFLQAEILHKAAAQYPKKDVQFLAIDVGEDEKTVRAFVKKRPFPYPVLLDEDEKVSGDFGVIAFPTVLIINRRGEVSYLREGIVAPKQLRELLAEAGAPTPPAARPAHR